MRGVLCAAAIVVFQTSLAAQAPATGERGLAPRETLQRIADLLGGDDVAQAGREADAALDAYPDDPALHNLAGVIAARRGEPVEAEAHFRAAIRLAPDAPPAYENLGRLYQEQAATDPGARAKALETYERLLRIDPDNAEGIYQSALLLSLEGRFEASRALVARLPDRLQERPQVAAVTVANLAGLGNREAGMAAVARLVEHPDLTAADVLSVLAALDRAADEAVVRALLEGADRRGVATPAALHRLGLILARNGRLEEARGVLDRAASAAPSAGVLLDLARVATRLGRHKEALGYLAHARSLEPENAAVHFLFGMVCVELNLGREAYESLLQAVAIAPENASINYALGAVAIHRHDPSEAVPYFEKYVALEPDDPRGRFALGAARFYANQFEQAKADLEQAARVPETSAGARYFLARIARQFNDLDAARRELQASLAANPEYADAWAELGLVQMRSGDLAGSERSLERALALDPDNYPATVNLATLYSRTKDPRRDAQVQRVAELQEKRAAAAQEFLRIVEVVP